MEDLRQTKAKEKAKTTTRGAKAKVNAGAKDTTSDLTKATKEATTTEDTTRAKEKATQDPKAMHQTKATKAKETTAKQEEWKQQLQDMPPMWHARPLGPGLQSVWHIGEVEELHPLEQEQAEQDNYDYDNSWDWNDNSYEDTANYIGGINESHLTIGHIRQAKSLLHKHKSKSLLEHTHNIMERPQQELSTMPPRRRNTTALRHSSSNTTAKEQRRLRTPSHTTSCTPTSSHTIAS